MLLWLSCGHEIITKYITCVGKEILHKQLVDIISDKYAKSQVSLKWQYVNLSNTLAPPKDINTLLFLFFFIIHPLPRYWITKYWETLVKIFVDDMVMDE